MHQIARAPAGRSAGHGNAPQDRRSAAPTFQGCNRANAQLQQLKDFLEEEDSQDHDYYIDADLLEYLKEEKADPALLEMLQKEITAEEGVEVEWREE